MKLKQLFKKVTLLPVAFLCRLLMRTEWYKALFVDAEHELYPGNDWYRKHEERNFRIVTLGSSGAKWAFDFTGTGVKGMNWAQQPQTLTEDYRLLRNFHSILSKGGVVIITIMPFTGLNKQTGMLDALKYLKIGAHEPIEPQQIEVAARFARWPILFGKPALKALLRYLTGRDQAPAPPTGSQGNVNPLSAEALEADARLFIDGWKRQFGISSWEAPLTPANAEGRLYRLKLMRELVDFCLERGYRPVYVIPPVTQHLAQYYTPTFEELYVYSFLRDVARDIPLLDYSKCKDLQRDELYFNSFFLNAAGRHLFTRRVLADLRISRCL